MIFCNFINILSLMSIINSFYFWSSTFNLLKIVVHHLETLDKQFNNRFFKDFIFLSNFSNQIIQKTLLNSKLSLKIWKIQLGILSKRRKIYESKLMETKLITLVILGRLVINILNKCYLMIKCSPTFNLIKKKPIKSFSINMMCIITIYL